MRLDEGWNQIQFKREPEKIICLKHIESKLNLSWFLQEIQNEGAVTNKPGYSNSSRKTLPGRSREYN